MSSLGRIWVSSLLNKSSWAGSGFGVWPRKSSWAECRFQVWPKSSGSGLDLGFKFGPKKELLSRIWVSSVTQEELLGRI